MVGNDFSFVVEDEAGTVVATATNDLDGSVSFPAIQFTEQGVYQYTILETTPSGDGWVTDTTPNPVTITVSDNGQGQLNATVTYPSGVPLFHNRYIEYAVHFASNGGSAVPDQHVPYGDAAQRPADPTRQGYAFCGWFANPALTIPYDFDTPVTETTTLYACWSATEHDVTFDSNGGSAVPTQHVPDGDPAQRPADPTRQGYAFCGWFADPALTIPYDFNTPVTEAITLYACWRQASEKVLIAHKVLRRARLADGQFHFELLDENGVPIATATNDADGNIYFDSGVFAEGEHVYTIREVAQNCPTDCYRYDVCPKLIAVTVGANGEIAAGHPPTFVNCFLGCTGCRYLVGHN
jgi:pilin isopeptide linkage protein/uncharacterized repeat protein (TIGR02543 family)